MSIFFRSLLWTVLFPGSVTILIPWLLIRGERCITPVWGYTSLASIFLILVGAAVLLWSIHAFAVRGSGTLSPADPAKRLVISGLYRYVRNPMYVGVVAILLGEALLFESLLLLGYAGLIFLLFNLFVRFYEEPYLRQQFGAEYVQYCSKVGRWIPGKPF